MQTTTSDTKSSTNSTDNPAKRASASKPTKADKIVALLRRPKGATIAELAKFTDWQAHSIRGFLSGTVKKRMGFEVLSEKDGKGVRRYRIAKTEGA